MMKIFSVLLLVAFALAIVNGYTEINETSLKLLKSIVREHRAFLDIPYEDVIRFMALEKAADDNASDSGNENDNEGEAPSILDSSSRIDDVIDDVVEEVLAKEKEKEKDSVSSKSKSKRKRGFVGLPAGSGHQKGKCDKVLSAQSNLEWIHGSTNMTTGAMTLIYFLSQDCTSCHEVAIKINNIYKEWRHRGLNVVAIHSSPKGFAATHEDTESLLQFVKEEGIEFAIANLPAKNGQQPMLRSGLPDWKKAARIPTTKGSFYNYLYDEMEYVVPLAIIYKNCVPLMADPLDGYHIMALDRSIAASQDMMLWPYGQLYDDEVQHATFEDAASSHGVAPEELELEWESEGDGSVDPYAKMKPKQPDHIAGGTTGGDVGSSSPRSTTIKRGRRRKTTSSRRTSIGSSSDHNQAESSSRGRMSASEGERQRRSQKNDPRDDESAIIHGLDDSDSDSDNDNDTDNDSTEEDMASKILNGDVDIDNDNDNGSGSGSDQRLSGAARRKSRLAASRAEMGDDSEDDIDFTSSRRQRRSGGLKRRRGGVR